MKTADVEALFSKAAHAEKPASKSCPIAKALRLNQPVTATADVVSKLRHILHVWGQAVPGDVQLMRHESSYQQHMRERQKHTASIQTLQTNSTVVKPEGQQQGTRAWSKLTSVEVGSLRLFETVSGQMLVGTLDHDAQGRYWRGDTVGDVQPVARRCLRSCFQELAEKMFPKGTKLCIAEPFLKNIPGWKSWCACRQSRRSPRGKKFGWSWL